MEQSLQAPSPSSIPSDDTTPISDQTMENYDNSVYYGFGVFMGLRLEALKAMRDQYRQQHGVLPNQMVISEQIEGNESMSSSRAEALSSGPSHGAGDETMDGNHERPKSKLGFILH